MSVIRVCKTKDYSVMSNTHIRDINLNLKSKGLMSLMLALPEDWNYSVEGLVKLVPKDGETSVRSAIKELETFGYLERKPIRENGKIIDWEYIIYEKPFVEKPQVEKPQVENQGQLNTNILNTKEYIEYKEKSKPQKAKTDNIQECEDILNFWNSLEIVKHKTLNEDLIKAIKKALSTFDSAEIKIYITRYNQVLKDKKYYFSYVWSLKDFLNRKNGISDFTDEGSKWLDYTTQTNYQENKIIKRKTTIDKDGVFHI